MNLVKGITQTEDGVVKSTHILIGRLSVLWAISENPWYTKGKKRLIPIWWDNKGLFIYKVAVKVGRLKGC